MNTKDHWLRSAKLPVKAVHVPPSNYAWAKEEHVVTVSAIDSHGAIVRRRGRMRYYASLGELKQQSHNM